MPPPMDNLEDMRKYANALALKFTRDAEKLADKLIAGEINLAQFHAEMKDMIKECHKLMFITGYGGDKSNIDMNDFARLGSIMRKQYDFLREFMKSISKADREGKSLEFVKTRAKAYIKASKATFWNAAVGFNLPQVPGDGHTRCKHNCKCYLDVKYETNNIGQRIAANVYWKLRPAEHCVDCRQLAQEWRPKRFEVRQGIAYKQAVRIYLSYLQDLPTEDELLVLLGSVA